MTAWPTNRFWVVDVYAEYLTDFDVMKPSVIVRDLETVPDLGGFAAANDLVGRSNVEVREAAFGDERRVAATTEGSC